MSETISEGGDRLRVFLDGTHVETRWIADYHVVWQTGQRNGPAEGDPAHHTHCSAYVAAAALYVDIYILRPPNHKQLHPGERASRLAPAAAGATADLPPRNRDGARLGSSGKATDVLDDAITAANAGKLVVAGYLQPLVGTQVEGRGISSSSDHRESFPSDEGPQVVTAGVRNFKSASMKFASGIALWPGPTAFSFLSTTRLLNEGFVVLE